MYSLKLTPQERELLIHVLETSLDDVRGQLIAADNMLFKEMLRQRKTTMLSILSSLKKEEHLPLAE
ncbi:MAG: hypothetical protein AB1453_09180 [Chloroflexota bacterium]|jgi:hypothetical protein